MKLKFLVSTIVSIMIWPASIMAQSELIPMIEIPAGNFYMGLWVKMKIMMKHLCIRCTYLNRLKWD